VTPAPAAVSIIVACHGPVAAALKASAEMICGPLPSVAAVGLEADDSPEVFEERLGAAVEAAGGQVLILADLVGGTPHNVAAVVLRGRPKAALVSGVSLGLLIEAALTLRSVDRAAIDELVARARGALAAWRPPPVGSGLVTGGDAG
jgi:mannose/fructose-specific phosphotransferase system component IIA